MVRPPGLFPPTAYRRHWSAKRIEMASGRWFDQRSALEALPPIDDGGTDALRATGTDGRLAAVLAPGLSSGGESCRTMAGTDAAGAP